MKKEVTYVVVGVIFGVIIIGLVGGTLEYLQASFEEAEQRAAEKARQDANRLERELLIQAIKDLYGPLQDGDLPKHLNSILKFRQASGYYPADIAQRMQELRDSS